MKDKKIVYLECLENNYIVILKFTDQSKFAKYTVVLTLQDSAFWC